MEENRSENNVLEEQKKQLVKEQEHKQPLKEETDVQIEKFAELPIESLIGAPITAAEKGQQELTAVYIDGLEKLAYEDDKTHKSVETTVGYHSWFGLDASITGNVSSDSEHKRQTDSSATYKIHARAVQQPPSEGMAKLTALFAQAMEPIQVKEE